MKRAFIYALCEPGTRTVRYIGLTYDVNMRLQQHVTDTIKQRTYTGRWLAGIVKGGQAPGLIILSEVSHEEGTTEETRFIRNARMLGMKLTNATDGGEGVINPSAETRQKESQSKKLMYAQHPELREKFIQRMKRCWRDPEFRAKRKKTLLANQTPESRQNFRDAMKAKNSRPEVRAKISAAVKARWADPEYRARRAAAFAKPGSYEKRCAAAKERSERPAIKDASRALHKKLWADPKFKAENTARIKSACSTPDSHARRSAAQKKRCATPEHRAKIRARWADPVFRAKTVAAMKKVKQKHL